MILPFPERIPINATLLCATVFFAIQRLEGTTLYFAAGCWLFIVIAVFAFNSAGGMTRASGAYIFFYSVLVVLIGIAYKAFLGEPADSVLKDPRTTITAYVASIAGLFVAAFVNSRLRRPKGFLESVLPDSQMYRSAVGCIAFGAIANSTIGLLGESGTQLQSTFGQLNQLVSLGIILGVTAEIRQSGGTRSINLAVLFGMAWYFIYGLLDFSKQGMILPLFCWLLPVWTLRYRLSRAQVLCCLAITYLMFHYLVPYSQFARRYTAEGQTYAQRVPIALGLLENAGETSRAYMAEQAGLSEGGLNSYYKRPQGFWERLQFVSADDALIDTTDQGKVFGLLPIKLALLNTIPHFVWPNKPKFNPGNTYAHEIGGLTEEDTTTGVSFSPTAEAYHMALWKGVLVVAPMVWFSLFLIFDSLLGDLRSTPWGLLAVALIAHVAPEGGISGVIYLFTFGTEILIFCALFATWVAPVLANAVLGPGRGAQRLSPQPHTAG